MASAAEIDARIELYVRNDAVKAFHNLQLNFILHALNQNISDSVSGVMRWGNIVGDINDQTDLITLINTLTVKVRNTIADLTGDGIEIVVNTGIYNNGTLILGTTPPFTIYVSESDFSGTTCTKVEVESIPNNQFSVYVNQWNRYLRWRQPAFDGGAYNEIELTGTNNFKINIPGFDPAAQEFDMYVTSTI